MDRFETYFAGLEAPAASASAIVPNDGEDLSVATRALYVGGSGDVRVILVGDDAPVTFRGMFGGVLYPMRVRRVLSAGTTALDIVGII